MRAALAAVGLGLFAGACAAPAPVERATEPRDPSSPSLVAVDAADVGDAGDASDADEGSDARDADHAAGAVGDAGGEDVAEHPALGGFPELFELRDGNDELGVVSIPLGARE